MKKEQLLSLWNADNWEVMSCGVYFTAHRADKELHINCNDYTEAEILAMPFWERLAQELDELDRQGNLSYRGSSTCEYDDTETQVWQDCHI